MNEKRRVFVTLFLLFVLVMGLYFFTDWFSKVTGYFTGDDQKIRLATCLRTRGAELYTESCSACESQFVAFGETAYSELTVIDCSNGCPSLRSLPAWFINEKFEYGFKSLKELEDLSGCMEEP